MALKRRFFHGAQALGLGTLLSALLKLAQLVVLARWLAPEAFGVFALSAIVMGVLSHLLEIGAGSVVVHRQAMSDRALSALFWVGLAIALAIVALLQLSAPLLAAYFHEPGLEGVLRWLSLVPLIGQFGVPYRSVLQRDLRMGRVAAVEVTATLAGFCGAIGAARAGWGVQALVVAQLLAAATTSLLFVAQGWRAWRPGLQLEHASLRDDVQFGARLAAQRLVNYVYGNVDSFLIGALLGSQPLGHYSMAYNLANMPAATVNGLLGRVAFPALAATQDDLARTRANYLRIHQASLLVNAPLVLGLAVVAPLAIPVLLGPAWTSTVTLLQVLCAVGLARCIGGTVGPLLLARGRPDLGLRWSVLMLALQVPAILTGLTFGGVLGAAIAHATLQACAVGLTYLVLVRTLLGPCLRQFAASTLRPCLPAALMAAVVAVAANLVGERLAPGWALGLEVGLGVAAYAALVPLFYPRLLAEVKDLMTAAQPTA